MEAHNDERSLLTIEDVLDIEYLGAPARSGNGRFVATTLHTDGTVLLVADAETGSSHRVAPDDDVTEFAWGDDRLAYRFADRETKQVGVVDVDTGDLVWRTTDTASTHSPAWLDDGRLLFVRLADGRTRRAFVAVDIDDGTQTVLFAETDAERGIVDRGAPTVSPDGTTLPAVVWVHGGPMRQMRDGWHPYRSYGLAYAFHQYLGREGYVGLFVNYRGGIGYGREFRASLAEGHGRDEMGDVAAGAAYLKDLSYVDPDAVGIWGLSYGGYATLQLLGTRPGTFAVGVNIAGLADIRRYEEWAWERKFPQPESLVPLRLGGSPWDGSARWDDASPWTHMDACEAPVYNFHGTADSYVNVEQQDIVVDRLFDLDKEFEAEYYPDEGHVFSKRAWRRTLERIERAFDRHLFT